MSGFGRLQIGGFAIRGFGFREIVCLRVGIAKQIVECGRRRPRVHPFQETNRFAGFVLVEKKLRKQFESLIVVRIFVEQRAQNLLGFFNPLTGGKAGTGWDFGGTIYFSDIYRTILNTAGVARLASGAVTLYVDGLSAAPSTDVPLDPDELVYSESHRITATYS